MRANESRRRALLLLDHDRNRELLAGWLGRSGSIETTTDPGEPELDLVVADLRAFVPARARLHALREQAAPAYLPLLLVVPERQAGRLPAEVWREADEVLTTPVRQGELDLRLERLLGLRERSTRTARRLAELGRSNSDLEQFAYAAAHELSSPLTVVSGVIDTLVARPLDGLGPEVAELLAVAQQQSARLQRLIGDLLAYSRVGTIADAQRVDLAALADETLTSLAQQVAASRALVEIASLPVVTGDAGQLRLVLANLVGNALKYGRPGIPPVIRITCEVGDGHWVVSVADNGVGIPPEQAAAVFDMFTRADAQGRREGHGIGLALCRRAIERHGGEIWVEPAPTGGSVFRFTLPRPPEQHAA